MKRVITLIILSLTIVIYSQNSFNQDKIVSKHGGVEKCFILKVSNNLVITKANNNSETKFFLDTISEIEIGKFGTVYTTETGFKIPIDSLNAFLNERNRKGRTKIEIREEEERSELKDADFNKNTSFYNDNRRFFFALYSFPEKVKEWSIAHNVYSYDWHCRPQIFIIEREQTIMESQFGFNTNQNLFVVFSIGYNSSKYTSNKFEQSTNHDGSIRTTVNEHKNSMDIFRFEVGIKHYFGNFSVKDVNPFITLDVGKQFAFVDYVNKSTSGQSQTNLRIESNESEFMEDINSPLLASFGFGAEYAISESLTLSGIIKVNYSSVSATYKWNRFENNTNIYQHKDDIEKRDIIYRTGLGLTFFF